MTRRATIRIDFDDKPGAPDAVVRAAWPRFRDALRKAAEASDTIDALSHLEVTVTYEGPEE